MYRVAVSDVCAAAQSAVCTSKVPLKNSVDTYTASAKRKDAARCLQGVGACGRIRTGDLLITSELLCQLSHTSINADGSIAHFAGAVNRFSGEESLFLLRLLPKWVRTGNDNT